LKLRRVEIEDWLKMRFALLAGEMSLQEYWIGPAS